MVKLGWIATILGATLLPGCIVLTSQVYDPVPDPLADHFVTGASVTGRTVTLADGRQVQLAGVDVRELDNQQRGAFEGGLLKLVTGDKKLLILDKRDGVAFVAVSGQYRYPWERFPAIILFPVHVKVTPERIDVALQIIEQGLAKVRESEISDPTRLAGYRQAAQRAQRAHIGVWRTDIEYLCDAAAQGKLDKVKAMAGAGVSVNAVGYTDEKATTPLIAAAAAGRDEVVEFLLNRGADVNAHPFRGTALAAAAAAGQAKVVSLLIAAGADLNIRYWSSPLEDAVSRGHVEVVRLMLESGAKTGYAGSGNDDTPLFIAARDGKLEIVKLLVDHGAKVGEANRNADTPLAIAAANDQQAVVEYLLAKGADVNARDTSGYTPHRLARQNYHTAIVQLLEKAGGHE